MFQAVHHAQKTFSRGYYSLLKKQNAPVEKLADHIKALLRGIVCEVHVQREKRIWINTPLSNSRNTIAKLIRDENYLYISAITAVELPLEFELIYHLTFADALVSVRVKVDQNNAVVPTTTDLIPGATLYEREVNDMFGVKFDNHPDLSPLLLPDDWRQDINPLRKRWTQARINKAMENYEDKD